MVQELKFEGDTHSSPYKKWKVLLPVLFLIAATTTYFLFSKPTVILQLQPEKTELFIGDQIIFERMLNTNAKIKGTILHQVLDKTGQLILQKTEQLTIDKQNKETVKFPTTRLQSGKYTIQTLLRINGKEQEQHYYITIKEGKTLIEALPTEITFAPETEITINCPKECDDFNTCTTDTCQQGTCTYAPQTPCCGNGNCEPTESGLTCPQDCTAKVETPQDITQKAKITAESNPNMAVSLCTSITQPVQADQCVYDIALKTNNSQACTSITKDRTRDSCYMEFALQDDFSICDLVQNHFQKTSCKSLQNIKIQQQAIKTTQEYPHL
ncbi:MAG: hypothetical protein HY363_01625 [Candidatus Aenigmarchaeota archaeon]|nr:hypothetical protein [Candidatus Aenigmarchaeota archaeon]